LRIGDFERVEAKGFIGPNSLIKLTGGESACTGAESVCADPKSGRTGRRQPSTH